MLRTLTTCCVSENINSRERTAKSTTDFISNQLDQAKADLDAQDAKLAEFKKQYSGQLPGDEDNNLKVLASLESQLDANTQTINRAQQDKAYVESTLDATVGRVEISSGKLAIRRACSSN